MKHLVLSILFLFGTHATYAGLVKYSVEEFARELKKSEKGLERFQLFQKKFNASQFSTPDLETFRFKGLRSNGLFELKVYKEDQSSVELTEQFKVQYTTYGNIQVEEGHFPPLYTDLKSMTYVNSFIIFVATHLPEGKSFVFHEHYSRYDLVHHFEKINRNSLNYLIKNNEHFKAMFELWIEYASQWKGPTLQRTIQDQMDVYRFAMFVRSLYSGPSKALRKHGLHLSPLHMLLNPRYEMTYTKTNLPPELIEKMQETALQHQEYFARILKKMTEKEVNTNPKQLPLLP